MKAILEFTIPEEQHEHMDALQGSTWKWAVDDIINYLRKESKHVDHTVEEYKILDAARERVAEILKDRGLEMY